MYVGSWKYKQDQYGNIQNARLFKYHELNKINNGSLWDVSNHCQFSGTALYSCIFDFKHRIATSSFHYYNLACLRFLFEIHSVIYRMGWVRFNL